MDHRPRSGLRGREKQLQPSLTPKIHMLSAKEINALPPPHGRFGAFGLGLRKDTNKGKRAGRKGETWRPIKFGVKLIIIPSHKKSHLDFMRILKTEVEGLIKFECPIVN